MKFKATIKGTDEWIIGHIAKNIRPEEIALLQANDADTGQDKCHIQRVIVSGFACEACGSDNIEERSGYKVCFDCGKSH